MAQKQAPHPRRKGSVVWATVLSWLSSLLLALLALGFKGIRLGPTLPAFLSPGVAKVLTEKFGIRGIADAPTDVDAMMNGN